MLHTIMITLSFLLLALSPFVIFDSDYAFHSVSWIPFKTLMILGRNTEQEETTHHIQEWQHWLSFFWSYLLLLAHLSTKCSWWAIVVSECPSCVVHCAASTIALKAYSSFIPGPIDLILGRKHHGGLLKISFSLLLLHWKANWLQTW